MMKRYVSSCAHEKPRKTCTAADRQTCHSQSPEFYKVQKRAEQYLMSSLEYRQVDVRDCPQLNHTISAIGDEAGRIDGLIAAAGVQQETPALEYTPNDSDVMLEINVTGAFMTAQAVAKQMIRFGNGGSIAMMTSMSGTVANKVSSRFHSTCVCCAHTRASADFPNQ